MHTRVLLLVVYNTRVSVLLLRYGDGLLHDDNSLTAIYTIIILLMTLLHYAGYFAETYAIGKLTITTLFVHCILSL